MIHWASSYIGKPHREGALGPDAFSCWGLVREIVRLRQNVELPLINFGEERTEAERSNVIAIKQAARFSGMKPQRGESQPLEDDIVLMMSVATLHCGYVLRANGSVGVLHSASRIGVVFQPWREAVAGMNVELWRRVA